MSLPVEVLGGVAHAVDAVIGGEVLLDGVLQSNMVLLCHCRPTTKGTSYQPYPSLAIHFHPSDACTICKGNVSLCLVVQQWWQHYCVDVESSVMYALLCDKSQDWLDK